MTGTGTQTQMQTQTQTQTQTWTTGVTTIALLVLRTGELKNRNILPRYFQWVPTTYVFCRNKKMSQSMTKLTIRLVGGVNTNQPAHPHSLIKVFADRMCLLQPMGYPKRDKGEPLPNWLGVLADLSLCWSHRFYCRFCRALAQMIQCSLYNSHPRKQGPVVQTNAVVS